MRSQRKDLNIRKNRQCSIVTTHLLKLSWSIELRSILHQMYNLGGKIHIQDGFFFPCVSGMNVLAAIPLYGTHTHDTEQGRLMDAMTVRYRTTRYPSNKWQCVYVGIHIVSFP